MSIEPLTVETAEALDIEPHRPLYAICCFADCQMHLPELR